MDLKNCLRRLEDSFELSPANFRLSYQPRQDSVKSQMDELKEIAYRLGMYDALDHIQILEARNGKN